MSSSSTDFNGGLDIFCLLLTIIFVVLKLTGAITWEWIWVLSPLWLFALVFLGLMALAVLIAIGAVIVQTIRNRS